MGAIMSRRHFVVVAATALTALCVSGCSKKAGGKTEDVLEETLVNPINWDAGEWRAGSCIHGCGNRCANLAYVVDGVVLTQQSIHSRKETLDFPLKKPCLRGLSQRKRIYDVGRLRYPMKRKSWEPFTGGKKELRGVDEWERISWDDAIKYVADELKNSREKYGARSILLCDAQYPITDNMGRFFAATGGAMNHWFTNSYGSFPTAWLYGYRQLGTFHQCINDRLDLLNVDFFVMFGMNPAWNATGNVMRYLLRAKEKGAKFVCIDPFYNDTASLLDAEWIPIHPGTDHALMLGLAHELLTLDKQGSMIDWDFLNRCTIGFDADHMPAGANPAGNFKSYLTGESDSIAKTPEWAEEITGVPASTTKALAARIGKDVKCAILSSLAPCRYNESDHYPQMLMTLGAMTGHMGKSGHMTGDTCEGPQDDGGMQLVKAGGNGMPQYKNPVDDLLNSNWIWDAVLSGRYVFSGGFGSPLPAEERKVDVHIIFHGQTGSLQHFENFPRGVEAHRAVDFVVTQDYYFGANAQYSDIVLPITTDWENPRGTQGLEPWVARDFLQVFDHVTDAVGESKSVRWIATELGKKLGYKETDIFPMSEGQITYNWISSAKVLDEDGKTYKPLVTITQKEIDEMGAKGKPQQGVVSIDDLYANGGYQVPRSEGDNYGHIAFKEFRADPEKYALESKSGKLEIYSAHYAETITAMGGGEVSPIPVYKPTPEGYHQTFSNWKTKEKGAFPLQQITPHYPRRCHTLFDDVPQLREAWASPVYMSAADAKERGISEGDGVLVSSEIGKTARPVCISQRVMPGVVLIPHGSIPDIDPKTGIDFGGHDNNLHKSCPRTQNADGYNATLVQIVKYDGKIVPDVERAIKVPIKEAK